MAEDRAVCAGMAYVRDSKLWQDNDLVHRALMEHSLIYCQAIRFREGELMEHRAVHTKMDVPDEYPIWMRDARLVSPTGISSTRSCSI